MNENDLLIAHLSQLLSSTTQHLVEVESDLHQTNHLLHEAIVKLTANFKIIHQVSNVQNELIEKLSSEVDFSDQAIVTLLKQHSAAITKNANAAITNMQFQDLTNQLINRTSKRIAVLKKSLVLDEFVLEGKAVECTGSHLVDWIDNMKNKLHRNSMVLDQELWKSVCQTHMESGDIELF